MDYDLSKGMDKTDGAEVGDVLGTVFLRNEGGIRGVQPVKMRGMEARKMVNGHHDVTFDMFQQALKKAPVNPSDHGALSPGISNMAILTSSSEKGSLSVPNPAYLEVGFQS